MDALSTGGPASLFLILLGFIWRGWRLFERKAKEDAVTIRELRLACEEQERRRQRCGRDRDVLITALQRHEIPVPTEIWEVE